MPGQSKMEDPAGSSHFLLQSMRVPSRSPCSASLSKLIGLAKSNTVTTSPVQTLLQYYAEGKRVEDREISLECELKDYLEVWGFCFVFIVLNVLLVFEMVPTATESRKKLLGRGNENGVA